VYIAWLNQSAWVYDPLYQSWWRYVDYADPASAGVVHPEIDRLTGRQLHFENVIVLFAQHEVISPTNLEIRMEQDWLGDAQLFRDGKMYNIRWRPWLKRAKPVVINHRLSCDVNLPQAWSPGSGVTRNRCHRTIGGRMVTTVFPAAGGEVKPTR
jgi:hypothetical protein